MTSDVQAAVERLNARVKERTGTLSRSPVVADVACILSELSRLREENEVRADVIRHLREQVATLTRALRVADGYARPTLDFTIHHGFREQADKAKEDKAFIDASLSRQSKEGGE